MRRLFPLTLLIAPLVALPAQAQERVPPPDEGGGGVALINNWIHRFMGREPNRQDIANGRAIDDGTLDPNDLLPAILSCDEYYNRAGGDNVRYIRKLFHDVVGRVPSQREIDYWDRRLQDGPAGMDGRTEVAAALLRRYPLNAAPARPFDRDRDFDRR